MSEVPNRGREIGPLLTMKEADHVIRSLEWDDLVEDYETFNGWHVYFTWRGRSIIVISSTWVVGDPGGAGIRVYHRETETSPWHTRELQEAIPAMVKWAGAFLE